MYFQYRYLSFFDVPRATFEACLDQGSFNQIARHQKHLICRQRCYSSQLQGGTHNSHRRKKQRQFRSTSFLQTRNFFSYRHQVITSLFSPPITGSKIPRFILHDFLLLVIPLCWFVKVYFSSCFLRFYFCIHAFCLKTSKNLLNRFIALTSHQQSILAGPRTSSTLKRNRETILRR